MMSCSKVVVPTKIAFGSAPACCSSSCSACARDSGAGIAVSHHGPRNAQGHAQLDVGAKVGSADRAHRDADLVQAYASLAREGGDHQLLRHTFDKQHPAGKDEPDLVASRYRSSSSHSAAAEWASAVA